MEAERLKGVCHLHNLGTVIEDAIKEDYTTRKVLKMSKQPNIPFTHLKRAPSGQSMKLTYMTGRKLEAVEQLLQDKAHPPILAHPPKRKHYQRGFTTNNGSVPFASRR